MNNKQINGNIISISKSYNDFKTVSTGNINDESLPYCHVAAYKKKAEFTHFSTIAARLIRTLMCKSGKLRFFSLRHRFRYGQPSRGFVDTVSFSAGGGFFSGV